jgi:glycosyltransferase involved in cell wall biosynthesis
VAVSVVLACRNAEAYVATQLDALSRQQCADPWELVVSDNGSTDRTLAIVESFRERFPRLVVVDSSATPGPGAARNAGVRAASGDRILFCDADDEVGDGWLSAMAEGLREHPFVAARLEHSRLNTWSGLRQQAAQPGLLQSSPPFVVPYMMTCALGVRRSVHESVDGFDEAYRDSGEDRDYCYRIQLGGHPLTLVPGAVVHYRHRETVRATYRQARGYGRGHVQMYRAYRHLGMQRPSVLHGLLAWALLPFRLIRALPSRPRLVRWAARLGWRVGRVEGCVRYRVWAP